MLNDLLSDSPVSAAALEARGCIPRPDGDQAGLRWKGSRGGWPTFVRILIWATRNNRTDARPTGARRKETT